jgi:aryl-alcohol dehydrogenase-like predicted oxidoreductase
MNIPLRRLGKSDLQISPLGLGCWQFSKQAGLVGKYWSALTDDDTVEIVKTSIDGGINWFDTAEIYGRGKSEQGLANALKKNGQHPNETIIATKWWPIGRRASSINRTIDKRLENLNGYPIALHQVHNPFGFSSVEKEMDAMADLIDDGRIKYIGVSNFNADRMRRASEALERRGHKLVSNQVVYSILNRKIESNGIMETSQELDITIIAYSPLAQGLVSGKFHEDRELIQKRVGSRKHMNAFKKEGLLKSQPVIDKLKLIAEEYNATSSQVALNWLVNFHGDMVVAIPGATKIRQAKENTGAMNFTLSEEHLDMLDQVSTDYKL